MSIGWFCLAVLSTYRLTRLITADQITNKLRVWADRQNRYLGYLVSCDWCLSIWLAPPIALAVIRWPDSDLLLIALAALSLSAMTGLVSLAEQRMDPDA